MVTHSPSGRQARRWSGCAPGRASMLGMRYAWLIVCAALALFVGGCSDDDDHPRAAPTATRAATTPSAVPTTPLVIATATLAATGSAPSATATRAAPSPTATATHAAASSTPTASHTAPPSPPSAATTTSTAPPTGSPTNPVLKRTPDAVINAGVPNGPAYAATDSLGMVHIYGRDQNASIYVQGYETAKARFWQMDAFRRAAEGRLSELFGAVTLRMDVTMRTAFTTRDGGRLEEELWQRLQAEEPQQAATAQAYANGINAWLADLRAGRNGATLPPEYTLVDVTAKDLAPWRPQDTLAIGRLQAYTLSETLEQELFYAQVFNSTTLPAALRDDVFRSAPAAPATVLPHQDAAAAPAGVAAPKPPPQPPVELLRSVQAMLEETSRFNPLGPADAKRGSNNWIVSPSLSDNGFAMLANDPHLPLFNPGIWHMVQLDSGGDLRVTGVNFPGLPGIILGHNDFGAWGATVAVFDVTDVYLEQVTTPADYPNSPRTVKFNGQDVEVLRVVEQFGMPAGTAVSAVIEVVPHHGPMVPDPDPSDDVVGLAATNMTVRWTGQEVSLDSRFLTQLNQARNVEEFKSAVRHFAVGAQNWV